MAKNTVETKSLQETLGDRKLYLIDLVKLITGNYKMLTRVELLSISAINSEVQRIDVKLQQK
ncbi:hypothetical protein COO64_11130 [Pseudomonas donghuensis]|nr:hypothetical protein COO64_11130 [Pseudomonas donghuensis]